jgi:hypothetical protein
MGDWLRSGETPMSVIDRASDQATPRFPIGLIPIAVYFVAAEYYALDMSWGVWPLPMLYLENWDFRLSGGPGWRIDLAVAMVELETELAIALGAIVLIVGILRRALFRPVLIAWLALSLPFPLVQVGLMGEINAMQWPANAMIATALVMGCGGIVYALRSARLRAFFNR